MTIPVDWKTLAEKAQRYLVQEQQLSRSALAELGATKANLAMVQNECDRLRAESLEIREAVGAKFPNILPAASEELEQRVSESIRKSRAGQIVRYFPSNAKLLMDVVDTHPEVRLGRPTLKGTRFLVSQVFSELAADMRISDISEEYGVDVEALKGLLLALSEIYDEVITS